MITTFLVSAYVLLNSLQNKGSFPPPSVAFLRCSSSHRTLENYGQQFSSSNQSSRQGIRITRTDGLESDLTGSDFHVRVDCLTYHLHCDCDFVLEHAVLSQDLNNRTTRLRSHKTRFV